MTFRDTVKQYFRTGLYPTQAQFWDLFDKLFFKDEGLSRLEFIGQTEIGIPTGTWVDKIGIVTNGNLVVSCGTTPGGNDVFDSTNITGTGSVNQDVYFANSGTLYFTGITPSTLIIIFLR